MKKLILSLSLLLLPLLTHANEMTADVIEGCGWAFKNGGMMTGWNFWFSIMNLGVLIWLVVGILLIAFLWKQINKKK